MSYKFSGFPTLKADAWRSETPCLIELNTGSKTVAYPVLGKFTSDQDFTISIVDAESYWKLIDPYPHESLNLKDRHVEFLPSSDIVSWEYIDESLESSLSDSLNINAVKPS